MTVTPLTYKGNVETRPGLDAECEQVRLGHTANWCPSGRRLHLIDADNLAGSGFPTLSQVRAAHDAYRSALRPGPVDHTIIACSHKSGVAVGIEWPGTQLLWRSGPDGADLALLEALERIGDVSVRFSSVVVASGDGIFADAVRSIRGWGTPVVVAWGRGALSWELRRLASHAVQIFDPSRAPVSPPPNRPEIRSRPRRAPLGTSRTSQSRSRSVGA